jgi:hypothetical protein
MSTGEAIHEEGSPYFPKFVKQAFAQALQQTERISSIQ